MTPAFDRPRRLQAHWFQFFNAVNFTITLGAPVIVYAKTLGASSTVLGVMASFTPLLTVLQLPAAQHLERHGYKRFILLGWTTRAIFVYAIALIPLMGFLDQAPKLALLLAALFFFNLLRGIASAGWMPWLTALVPEHERGRYLSVDQIFMHAGCMVSLIASAFVMTGRVDPWEFSLVFVLAAVMGSSSVYFLRAIPDVPPGETTRRSSQRVPWREMLAYPPFRSLIFVNLLFTAVVGSLGVFTVEFLREESHFDVSTVLYLSAFSFLGALAMLPVTGSFIDRSGSKPVLRAALAMFAAAILVWCLIAAGILPGGFPVIAAVNILTGAASANLGLASARITMATMPEMGRNHFFALFTVITSFGLGVTPVAWGLVLDVIGSYEAVTGVFHWKRHSIYFLALLVLSGFAFASIGRLHESPGSGGNEARAVYRRQKRSREES